ncbi:MULTISPECIES: SMI1/KNR4 family protein [unclassified Bacillus (in: firmicutes)]|uniref:SMI1/KNR4 family protein n=1 Tax=unclassified Bacillus (in: firmicutes) TaxID=185979 RepID=UPI001BE6EC42|nr:MULTISPECIES: SMI1/KNR4 family protein [unclassified Bacillus (in: firmicutes)]MBT2618892.1 SMI1/KNR4 family protein [Bacillus sp. ISL-78]MBT2627868.1 SMI1/KNR4 family protein [Bacillus sp. ISL-101]
MNITGYKKATQEAINNFERYVDFEFPPDYKQFLLENNEGTTSVQQGKFYVDALDTLVSLKVLYGIDVKEKELNLLKWHEEYKKDLHTNCIIIGSSDMCAGKILLINNDEEKGIYFWDQGWYSDPSSQDENIYKVAESFKSFIEGLKVSNEI